MSLDLSDVYEELDDICESIIDEKTNIGLEKLKELTPEDTFDLQNDNQRSEVIKHRDILKTRIFNDNEHAEFVEYSKKEKRYYKDGWRRKWAKPFTIWKGAWMFRKTADFLENN